MLEILFKIWWMIAVLPFIIFLEGSKKFAHSLKKRNIYSDWDVWHSFIVALVIVLVILWFVGYR